MTQRVLVLRQDLSHRAGEHVPEAGTSAWMWPLRHSVAGAGVSTPGFCLANKPHISRQGFGPYWQQIEAEEAKEGSGLYDPAQASLHLGAGVPESLAPSVLPLSSCRRPR